MQGVFVNCKCEDNPGIAKFQLYDLNLKKVLTVSDNFYCSNDLTEFLGLVNSIYYCFHNNHEHLFSNSETAISWIRKKKYRSNLIRTKETEITWDKINKALKWLKTLEYTDKSGSFRDPSTKKIVYVHKWLESEWGKSPLFYN